jgi:hypothetical protein
MVELEKITVVVSGTIRFSTMTESAILGILDKQRRFEECDREYL